MAPRRLKVAAWSTLSALLAQGFIVPQASAAPDLWPDFKFVGSERVNEFKAGQEVIDPLGSGTEVAGTRKTVRRNERVESLREKDPIQNHESFEEVPGAPVFSTKIQGRIHSTMSATKFDKFRYTWTETPFKDYTVKKWDQRDEFLKDVPYRRTVRVTWTNPVSGAAQVFSGHESRYSAVESAVTGWVAAEDPKVFVGAGVDKSERKGPGFVSSRTEVKEVARKSLATVQAASTAAGSGGGEGPSRVFQGDSAKGVTQAPKATAGQVAANLGSRSVKSAQAASPVVVRANAAIEKAAARLVNLNTRSQVSVRLQSALTLLKNPDATDAQIKAALENARKNALLKSNRDAILNATKQILKARAALRRQGG
ncbi:MAG: hypothetical protein VKO64_10425 [Candidatus Sericytochromatia bacterium]|nr:hypothetical protein [Candidatus Sericytochromatia bacterium]